MNQHTVTTTWAGQLAFDSQIDRHSVRIDGEHTPDTDTGPGPKSLLLTALTGCSAIDVVMILQKMRVQFDALAVEAPAPLTDEHPKVYTEIRLTFRLSGSQIREEKVRHAVELSLDKYCGVAAMLRKHCPIRYEIEISETTAT
jgi:putative redox protein